MTRRRNAFGSVLMGDCAVGLELRLRKKLEEANQYLTEETQKGEDAMREQSRKMKDRLSDAK